MKKKISRKKSREQSRPIASPTSIGRRIQGTLTDFVETGTEGLIWSLADDANSGYNGLHFIHEGDHLTILDQRGHKLWAGTIQCDRKSGWEHYPMNPTSGQPSALGFWIHWTQMGFKPDDWARFFVRPESDRCRGVLVKKLRKKPKTVALKS